ncbi:MAG: hypothetical protein PHQ23_14325, partial [Candidatus Wallbacteria bacterium]|nr:hypothetical protein [Candidatus Wallbacteria bacterium]
GRCYFILSRGVSRDIYLLGKALGLFASVALLMILYSLFNTVFLVLFAGCDLLFIWQMLPLLLLKSMVWVSLLMLLALSGNTTFTISFGLLLYCFCNFSQAAASVLPESSMAGMVLSYLLKLLPELSRYNLQAAFVLDRTLPVGYIALLALYTVSYSTFILSLSTLIFRRKQL